LVSSGGCVARCLRVERRSLRSIARSAAMGTHQLTRFYPELPPPSSHTSLHVREPAYHVPPSLFRVIFLLVRAQAEPPRTRRPPTDLNLGTLFRVGPRRPRAELKTATTVLQKVAWGRRWKQHSRRCCRWRSVVLRPAAGLLQARCNELQSLCGVAATGRWWCCKELPRRLRLYLDGARQRPDSGASSDGPWSYHCCAAVLQMLNGGDAKAGRRCCKGRPVELQRASWRRTPPVTSTSSTSAPRVSPPTSTAPP
jgi:hypothetical protein